MIVCVSNMCKTLGSICKHGKEERMNRREDGKEGERESDKVERERRGGSGKEGRRKRRRKEEGRRKEEEEV